MIKNYGENEWWNNYIICKCTSLVQVPHASLIKNLYLSKGYGARRLLSEFPDKGWKLGSIDSLVKRSHKAGTIALQPGSGRPRIRRVAPWRTLSSVRGTSQKGTDQLVRFHTKLAFLFKCAQDNALWSPAQTLQTTSCSAVCSSQLCRSSYSLINNHISYTKSCYCSFINSKLNNK